MLNPGATDMSKNTQSKKIVMIKAGWHREIVAAFSESCIRQLGENLRTLDIQQFEVPGVVEIPLFARKVIDKQMADILIVVGLIADHGVYRHDFVARTVMDATMNLQMETGVPIIYGILTPQEFMSEGRESFFKDHFVKKGVEAAEACVKTLCNEERLALIQSA